MDNQSSMMDIFTHAATGSLPPMFRAYDEMGCTARSRGGVEGLSRSQPAARCALRACLQRTTSARMSVRLNR
jgi:hypothetical protein